MYPSSLDYEEVINRPIRPATQIIVREYAGDNFAPEDLSYSTNIDRELMKDSPNYEPIRNNTYYATFAYCGYCVGEENLRCVPDEKVPTTDVMPISILYSDDDRLKTLFSISNVTTLNQDIYITVAPTYNYSIRVFIDGYNGDTRVSYKYQTVSNTTTATTLHFVADAICEVWRCGFACDYDNVRISMYPPSPYETLEPKVLFSNKNITSVNYEKSTDLYVQDEFNYSLEVTALDIDRLFDPANPKGIYNQFTEFYRVLVTLGYEIEQGRFEYPYRKVMYLAEKPNYEGNKVNCKFGLLPWVADIRNNNLINPLWGVKPGAERPQRSLLGVLGSVYVYPPNFKKTFVTRAMSRKSGYTDADYQTDGYTSATSNSDIYKLLTNATGMYICEKLLGAYTNTRYGYDVEDFNEQLRKYFAGEISAVKHYTRKDITDDGFSLKIMPQLKTLTIKRYTNKDTNNVVQTITNFKIDKSKFVQEREGLLVAESELDVENNSVISSCKVYDVTGATMTWHTLKVSVDPDTGIPKLLVRVEVDSTKSISNTVTMKIDLYGVNQTVKSYNYKINEVGDDMEIDNPYITSSTLVRVAKDTITAIAKCREVYTLKVIQDIRLQLGDIITIDTAYEENVPCIVTGLKFALPSVKGEITCRRLRE